MHDRDEGFDELMARPDQAMVILTTVSDDVRSGCLIGFHSQSGIDPQRYAVWLSKANHTYRVAALADTFAVHFPSAGQHDLAELFGASSGDDVDKFERCRWSEGPDGVPLLDDCPNRFVARREGLVDVGTDHVCLDLRPIRSWVADDGGPIRLHDVVDVEPGHPAEDRQRA
jgi:flavin reductase (DIM6/NTAB) family NADH-FMN oxidoreductase RutF